MDFDEMWAQMAKCAQLLTTNGVTLQEKMTARKANIMYLKSYSQLYETLMYLQGPWMLMTFAREHVASKDDYEKQVKEVATQLLKVEPFTHYDVKKYSEHTATDDAK